MGVVQFIGKEIKVIFNSILFMGGALIEFCVVVISRSAQV